jgi:hypothetical protein
MKIDIGIDANKREAIAAGLSRVLADSNRAMMKSRDVLMWMFLLAGCPADGKDGDPGSMGAMGDMGDKGDQGDQGIPGPVDPTMFIQNGSNAQTASFNVTGTGTVGTLAVGGDASAGGDLAVTGNVRVSGYGAKTVYSQLMTGRWLNAHATFLGTRTHTLTSGRLDTVGTGTATDEKAYQVMILPAGALDPTAAYAIHLTLFMDELTTTDCDPILGVGDGTNAVAIWRSESGSSLFAWESTDVTDLVPVGFISNTAPTTAAGRHRVDVIVRLDTATELVAAQTDDVQPLTFQATTALNRANPIRVFVGLNSVNENVGVHAIRVSVVQEGP